MVQETQNLSTDFVQDMLAESPEKESKAVVEPCPEDHHEVMALKAMLFLGRLQNLPRDVANLTSWNTLTEFKIITFGNSKSWPFLKASIGLHL